MLNFAPIALFAYRRTRHLAATLDSLALCRESSNSPIFVFSDGGDSDLAKADVAAVRSLLRARQTKNMKIIEADVNRGLARSIVKGVSELCDQFGRVIVLEDDLIVAPATLRWFNSALDKYEADSRLMHLNGYQFDVPEFRNLRHGVTPFFVASWGWATWKRAWQSFDPDATGWRELLDSRDLRRAFDKNGAYPLSDMLIKQMTGRIDSWAIRWYWTCFRSGGLTLSPPTTLIKNIGFDQTATHNSLSWLKRLQRPHNSFVWRDDQPPSLPDRLLATQEEERALHCALLRTHAMRNNRIKFFLNKIGLWPSDK